jgi:ATP-dependent exoDNAse (exonuclease V) beta subunit
VAIPENSPGVRVLTMHQSKGLEFAAVIVPLNDGRGRNPDPLHWDQERLLYINADLALVQPELKDIYQRENIKSSIDLLNLLYVAFTRAKEALFIPVAMKKLSAAPATDKNGLISNLKQINLVKKQDNLLSKLLLPPLQGTSLRSRVKRITKASAIVSRHPKLTWSDNEQPQSITFGKLEIKAARQSSEKNLAGCPAIPAKKMLTSSWQKEYLVFDPAPIGGHLDLKSTERGDRIHNLLARLGDFSSREQVAARIRELAENEQWPENDIVVVSSYLCRDDVFQLLCRGQEVHCEKEVVDNSGAIANFRRLDRLQIGSEDVLVIDFKTGQETAVDHETQMEKYLSAITPLFPGNNCRGFLLYIDQGEVKEIKCSN